MKISMQLKTCISEVVGPSEDLKIYYSSQSFFMFLGGSYMSTEAQHEEILEHLNVLL